MLAPLARAGCPCVACGALLAYAFDTDGRAELTRMHSDPHALMHCVSSRNLFVYV